MKLRSKVFSNQDHIYYDDLHPFPFFHWQRSNFRIHSEMFFLKVISDFHICIGIFLLFFQILLQILRGPLITLISKKLAGSVWTTESLRLLVNLISTHP